MSRSTLSRSFGLVIGPVGPRVAAAAAASAGASAGGIQAPGASIAPRTWSYAVDGTLAERGSRRLASAPAAVCSTARWEAPGRWDALGRVYVFSFGG